MVISCIILAILGYYQLICLRKQGEDTIRKRQEALKKLNIINKHDSNPELLNLNGLLNDPATWSDKKVPTPNPDLIAETTSTKKFHRGTCRVSFALLLGPLGHGQGIQILLWLIPGCINDYRDNFTTFIFYCLLHFSF